MKPAHNEGLRVQIRVLVAETISTIGLSEFRKTSFFLSNTQKEADLKKAA